MVRLERFCAIRKRTRDDVNREHIRYNARLIYRIGKLINTQYRRVKNQEKWDRVMQVIGPMMYETGEVLGCKVEMTVNPELLTATLLYRGEALYMVREEIRGILCFADELAVYEDKGEFCFALTYSLCDAEQEADNSERIQALRFCLDASGGPKMEEDEI